MTEEPPARPGPDPAGTGSADTAYEVRTLVVAERGRWAVDVVVVFADGVVRKRIDTYPTEARARIAARLIQRAAERDLEGPLHG